MLTKTEKKFSIFFIFIVIVYLICNNVSSLSSLHYFTKPAILISLIIFFLKNSNHISTKSKIFMLLALVFSLIGDILLMFSNNSVNYFISGLISFLIAHVLYIVVFLKTRSKEKSALLFSTLLVVYALCIFYFLKGGLGDMLIPVVVYMSIILFMAISAFLRKGSMPNMSYNFVLSGAILFIISDSLLALNKFYTPFYFADISIIFTYAFAQLLIVLGVKKQR